MTAKKPVKKPPKKAPAKGGAKSMDEKRARARVLAVERAEKRAKFEAQYGEGHNAIEEFLDAFEHFDSLMSFARTRNLDDVDEFRDYAADIAKRIRVYLTHETRTLDEAFKVRRPDGYRQPAARKKYLKADLVQRDGFKLREHGAVVDDAFFEVLAERHLIGTTVARQYYFAKHKGAKPTLGKSAETINPEYIARLNWKK